MKLELKHIAPYLPFELKITYGDGNIDWNIMSSNHLSDLGNSDFQQFKPILRPLSDLTKQTEADIVEYSDIERVVFSGNPSDLYFVNTEEKTYLSDYMQAYEKLLKEHYDVFGLIEKGLAIDINTLKHNSK